VHPPPGGGSHPSRVRGLKWFKLYDEKMRVGVAPFTGAWIEMGLRRPTNCTRSVAPFTGAWIEIPNCGGCPAPIIVAPFTGAWIEIASPTAVQAITVVAPFTGAWIEIAAEGGRPLPRPGRTLHGCVD